MFSCFMPWVMFVNVEWLVSSLDTINYFMLMLVRFCYLRLCLVLGLQMIDLLAQHWALYLFHCNYFACICCRLIGKVAITH